MGTKMFIVAALLALVVGVLSACAQNPQADGVNASVDRADVQGNTQRLVEESTMMTTAEGDIAILAGGKPPPEYQVKKDGRLIIEGDMVVSCADLLLLFDTQQGNPTPKDQRQMRQASKEQVRVCTKAGFPPDKTAQSP